MQFTFQVNPHQRCRSTGQFTGIQLEFKGQLLIGMVGKKHHRNILFAPPCGSLNGIKLYDPAFAHIDFSRRGIGLDFRFAQHFADTDLLVIILAHGNKFSCVFDGFFRKIFFPQLLIGETGEKSAQQRAQMETSGKLRQRHIHKAAVHELIIVIDPCPHRHTVGDDIVMVKLEIDQVHKIFHTGFT